MKNFTRMNFSGEINLYFHLLANEILSTGGVKYTCASQAQWCTPVIPAS
jgi:hypothetical protein